MGYKRKKEVTKLLPTHCCGGRIKVWFPLLIIIYLINI